MYQANLPQVCGTSITCLPIIGPQIWVVQERRILVMYVKTQYDKDKSFKNWKQATRTSKMLWRLIIFSISYQLTNVYRKNCTQITGTLSNIKHKDFRPSILCPLSFVTLMGTPLKSEMGWTGEIWLRFWYLISTFLNSFF